jgi:hypothetical protein
VLKRGGSGAARTTPQKQRSGGGAVATSKQEQGSAKRDPSGLEEVTSGDVSPDHGSGRGLNGLNLNGLTLDGGNSLWGEETGTGEPLFLGENEIGDVEDEGFLTPIVQSELDSGKVGKQSSPRKEGTPGADVGADGSPKSSSPKYGPADSGRPSKESGGKASKKDGKPGDEKGGLLGGLRGLMSSGAQGLAAAVTAVGGAPPRDSLMDQDPPTPVDKSAKVYQHPIPVGDRKKPTPRNARRVPASKPRGGGESKAAMPGSRGLSPAGSRGVSPVGSPGGLGGLEYFKGGSPVDRCQTPNSMDKRGKLLGGRNGEHSYSAENLQEGPVYTGAVAEANAESVNGGHKKGLRGSVDGNEGGKGNLIGDWGEDFGAEKRGENSTDGWEQQGFLEGFSFSEDGELAPFGHAFVVVL